MKKTTKTTELPEVNFSDYGDVRCLHLGTEWIQGSMLIDSPFEIELEYVQRMMAWLLFVDAASVPKRRSMQLGLGAATCTKFCFKKLRMKTTAIEINPQVIIACRLWFKLPPDDAKLEVVLADAALEIQKPQWQGQIDALQVDLYDHEAAAPVLDSAEFYADCRRLLTDDGVMTVNLFGRSSSFLSSVEKISEAVWGWCGVGVQAHARGKYHRFGAAHGIGTQARGFDGAGRGHSNQMGLASNKVVTGV